MPGPRGAGILPAASSCLVPASPKSKLLPAPPALAVPPPRNPQPPGFRGDFLDALPIAGKRRVPGIPADYDFPDGQPRKTRKNPLK